uniref:Uncharacterized protein n=1 Tax=Eutreptiella gymnastica TaxID=73025 RepID=A0A7S4GKB2_9EUGL
MQVQALQGVDTSATYSQGSKPDPGNACPPAEDQGRIHGDADAKLQDLNASLHQYKWKCEALENRATLAETQLAQTQTQLGAVQQKEQDLLCSLQRAKTSMSMVDAERQRLQELCTSVEAKVAGFVSYEESHDKLVKSLQSELANAQRECQRLQKSMSQQGEEHREQVMLSTQKWELETQALKEEVQQLKADLAATTRGDAVPGQASGPCAGACAHQNRPSGLGDGTHGQPADVLWQDQMRSLTDKWQQEAQVLRQEVQRLQMLETHSTGGVREGTQQPLDRMWQTSSTSGTGSWGHGPQGPPSAAWWQAQHQKEHQHFVEELARCTERMDLAHNRCRELEESNRLLSVQLSESARTMEQLREHVSEEQRRRKEDSEKATINSEKLAVAVQELVEVQDESRAWQLRTEQEKQKREELQHRLESVEEKYRNELETLTLQGRVQLDKAEEGAEQLRAEIQRLERQMIDATSQKSVVDEETKRMGERIEIMQSEFHDLTLQIKQSKEHHESLLQEKVVVDKQLQELQTELSITVQQLDSQKRMHDDVEQCNHELRAEVHSLTVALKQQEQVAQEQRALNVGLAERVEALRRHVSEMSTAKAAELEKHKMAHEEEQANSNSLRSQLSALQQEFRDDTAKLEECKEALAEEKDSSESLRRQVAALKQELCDCATEASTKLKECQKEFEAYDADKSRMMEEARSQQLQLQSQSDQILALQRQVTEAKEVQAKMQDYEAIKAKVTRCSTEALQVREENVRLQGELARVQGGLRLSEDRWRTEVEQLQAAIKQAKLDLTASQGKHMEALEQLARLEAEHGFVKAGCQELQVQVAEEKAVAQQRADELARRSLTLLRDREVGNSQLAEQKTSLSSQQLTVTHTTCTQGLLMSAEADCSTKARLRGALLVALQKMRTLKETLVDDRSHLRKLQLEFTQHMGAMAALGATLLDKLSSATKEAVLQQTDCRLLQGDGAGTNLRSAAECEALTFDGAHLMAKVVALQGEITMEQKKNEELKEQLSLKETRMRALEPSASSAMGPGETSKAECIPQQLQQLEAEREKLSVEATKLKAERTQLLEQVRSDMVAKDAQLMAMQDAKEAQLRALQDSHQTIQSTTRASHEIALKETIASYEQMLTELRVKLQQAEMQSANSSPSSQVSSSLSDAAAAGLAAHLDKMKQKLSKVTADLRVQRSSPRVGLPYHSPPAEVEYRNWGSNVSCGSSVSPYQSAPMSPVPRVAVSNASLRSPENLAAVERLSPGHREIESAAMQPELPDNISFATTSSVAALMEADPLHSGHWGYQ